MIGAGAAGLSAAAKLAAAGLDVIVLEARDRIGGRVWSAHRKSGRIELGAEFVHGDAARTHALAAQAGAALVDVERSHWARARGRLARSRGYEGRLLRALRQVGRAARRGADMSFLSAVEKAGVREPARSQVLAYVESFQAALADRISAHALAGEDLGTERTRRVLPCYSRLLESLRGTLGRDAVELGEITTLVRWRPGHVEIETRNAITGVESVRRAHAAVIAVPLGVLKPHGAEPPLIAFSPAVPRVQAALGRLSMGSIVKLVLTFRRPIWTDRSIVRFARRDSPSDLGFIHAPGAAVPVWWTTHPIPSDVLTGWVGGARARAFLSQANPARRRAMIASLARALGVAEALVQRELVGCAWHDWDADPYSRGAYSYPLVGGAHAAERLAAPVEHTLYFAGEATCAPPANGTVEGALSSGERAARALLRTVHRRRGSSRALERGRVC